MDDVHPIAATTGDRDSLTVTAVVLALLAFFGAMVAVGISLGSDNDSEELAAAANAAPEVGDPVPVEVALAEFGIAPEQVRGTAGRTVLHVTNKGSAAHDLSVVGKPLHTPMLAHGEDATLDARTLPAGTYELRCDVPGHEAAGMVGTLVLTEEASASEPHAAMTPDQMDKAMHDRTAAFPQKTAGKGAQPLEPRIEDGVKVFEITASVVQWEVEAGKKVEAWAYNGTVPGPTISVDIGDKVRVVLYNKLPESTSIHFHGIRTPNSQDGVPDITQPPVKPGQSFTYEFTASRVEVGMYHSHHNAAKQVSNGLLGTFLVGRLPLPNGVTPAQELPMVLNDSGSIGFSLNGKSFPATDPLAVKPGEWFLVHYLNEGTQIHPMHLHGLDQLVVAKDGFPLPQPYKADTVTVAPGERFSVLVHADNPGVWAWHCHILPHAEREDGMFGMVTAVVVQ